MPSSRGIPSHRLGDLCQVYVLDRSTGMITPESISLTALPLGDSRAPSSARTDRVLTFETLDPPSGNPPVTSRHVVVRNRQNGVLRTPQSPRDEPPNGDSGEPVVSETVSRSCSRPTRRTWRRTRRERAGSLTSISGDSTTRRSSASASTATGRRPPMGASHSPSVSGDGELVAFVSTARLAAAKTRTTSPMCTCGTLVAARRRLSVGAR